MNFRFFHPRIVVFPLRCVFFLWASSFLLSLSTAAQKEEPLGIVASRVLYATDESVLGANGKIQQKVLTEMLDGLMMTLTGRHSAIAAWQSLLHPKDIVGIKVSAAGRQSAGTRIETVMAVVRSLRSAGYSKNHIIIWDRNRSDLLACGFSETDPNYTLDWIDEQDGYDSNAPVKSPLLGRLIWGDSKFVPTSKLRIKDMNVGNDALSNQSYFAKVLARKVTRVIHIPSLQDSFLTGVNGAIVGMTLHNLDNWRRFTTPPNYGDPYLAEIYAGDLVAGKIVLTILDALFLQYAGGPFPAPAQTMENFSLFISYDPVAIDFTARRLLNEARGIHRLPSLTPLTAYIETAAASGLGIVEEKNIHLQRVRRKGWQ